jgi:hypothetical protein
VVERWRGATMKSNAEDALREARQTTADAAPAQPAPPLAPAAPLSDPSRFNLLKKPVADRPDSLTMLRAAAPAPSAQPQRWPGK